MSILQKQLTQQEQSEILALFSLYFDNEGILCDSDGNEFYGLPKNDKYDFGTLEGILKYAKESYYADGERWGKTKTQFELQVLLGLRDSVL